MQKQGSSLAESERKRTNKILKFLIPATVIMVVLAVAAGIYANKAGNKKPASAEEFQIAATNVINDTFDEKKDGYAAISVVDQLENKDMFKDVLVCPVDENNSIYYYVFKNKGNAKSFFAGNARKMKEATKNALPENIKQENLENYSYYTASADGKYATIIRVGKTVFYAHVDDKHADKIKKIVEMLDY